MTLDELKAEISERIESEQEKMSGFNDGKSRKDKHYYISEGMVIAGVPDLCLPVSRGKYHALYIELKVGNNKATEKQRKWIKRLREQGNLALVCYGWEEASAVLLKYIKLKADSEDEKL